MFKSYVYSCSCLCWTGFGLRTDIVEKYVLVERIDARGCYTEENHGGLVELFLRVRSGFQRTVERFTDVPVQQVVEEIVQVVQINPRKTPFGSYRGTDRRRASASDFEEIVELVRLTKVQQRTVEQSWMCLFHRMWRKLSRWSKNVLEHWFRSGFWSGENEGLCKLETSVHCLFCEMQKCGDCEIEQ